MKRYRCHVVKLLMDSWHGCQKHTPTYYCPPQVIMFPLIRNNKGSTNITKSSQSPTLGFDNAKVRKYLNCNQHHSQLKTVLFVFCERHKESEIWMLFKRSFKNTCNKLSTSSKRWPNKSNLSPKGSCQAVDKLSAVTKLTPSFRMHSILILGLCILLVILLEQPVCTIVHILSPLSLEALLSFLFILPPPELLSNFWKSALLLKRPAISLVVYVLLKKPIKEEAATS